MKKNNLYNIKKVFMIGVGGIGMSGLARYFLSQNIKVIGSDIKESKITSDLKSLGVQIIMGQTGSEYIDDVDLVVRSEAITESNDDYKRAKEKGKEIKLYAEMLGVITEGYETIAICGTHGKTTTTGLVLSMMQHAGLDPMGIVGSLLKSGSNFAQSEGKSRDGKKYFVVEACEYRRSFLNLKPKYLIITNIDADHLDYYKDLDDIKSAFLEMCNRVSPDGYIICCESDKNVIDIMYKYTGNAKFVRMYDSNMRWFITPDLNINLQLIGKHNQDNAKLAWELGKLLRIPEDDMRVGLYNFEGSWRRCEYKGVAKNGAIVIDDYAHHPTEIDVTVRGVAEKYNGKSIIGVFQPHLHSRTHAFWDDFVSSLSLFDKVYILPIYKARSEEDYGVSSELLASKINGAVSVTFENVYDYLQDYNEDYVILTMGAGDNNVVAENLVNGKK